MQANVTHYTECEGGDWKPWPFPDRIKPSNPELLTMPPCDVWLFIKKDYKTIFNKFGFVLSKRTVYKLYFHAIKLSNGRVFDTINGFRDGGGPA
jgi:hypothetical protein